MGQLSNRELHPRAIDICVDMSALPGQDETERNGQWWRAIEKHVLGTLDFRFHAVAIDSNMNANATFLESLAGGTRGVEEKCALRAQQVRRAHRAQLRAVKPIRRKRDRHPQHGAPNAMLAENGPERLRTARQAQLRFVALNQVSSNPTDTFNHI